MSYGGSNAWRDWVVGRAAGLILAIVIAVMCGRLASAQTRATGPAAAAAGQAVSVTVELNAVGDAQCQVVLPGKFVELNDARKEDIARNIISAEQPGQVVDNLKVSADAAADRMTFGYTVRGFARSDAEGQWWALLSSIPIQAADSAEVPSWRITDTTAVLKGSFLGLPATCRLILPPGSGKIAQDAGRFSYELPRSPDSRDGTSSASSKLDAKPQIMASLCKSYGYPIPEMWVARAVFKNTGSKTIADYRVRFRVRKFADDWSDWAVSREVIPGQSVVDIFHPLFDLEKIAQSDGTRLAVVDMQCQYTADGKQRESSASQTVEILARNEVIWDHEHIPFVLASFVTKDDPVIQRVAAMVSSQIPGGIAASSKIAKGLGPDNKPLDRNLRAELFMKELYRFMLYNKFVYQTPPMTGNVQHVKYPRDVVLNRAGTCVDLAIFYASVCEAVGLHPMLYMPPGHCFPGVYLPADPDDPDDKPEVIAIEATLLNPGTTFYDVASRGYQEREKPKPGEEVRISVNIASMRQRDVHSLELPPLPQDALERAGIAPAPGDFSLLGVWKCTFTLNGQTFITTDTFTRDGTENCGVVDTLGRTVFQISGAYKCVDGRFTFESDGVREEAKVKWTDPDHFTYTTEKCNVPSRPIGVDYNFSRAN